MSQFLGPRSNLHFSPVYTVETSTRTSDRFACMWSHLEPYSTLISFELNSFMCSNDSCTIHSAHKSVCTQKTTAFTIPGLERRKEIGPYLCLDKTKTLSIKMFVFFCLYICFLYMHKEQMCFHDWGGECFSFTLWVATGWLLCDLWWNGTVYHKSQTGELFFTHKYYSTLTFVHSRASSTQNKWSNHGLLSIWGPPCPYPIALTHTCTCTHP